MHIYHSLNNCYRMISTVSSFIMLLSTQQYNIWHTPNNCFDVNSINLSIIIIKLVLISSLILNNVSLLLRSYTPKTNKQSIFIATDHNLPPILFTNKHTHTHTPKSPQDIKKMYLPNKLLWIEPLKQ